ncbi:MAG: ATP-binding protein [Ruminococcus sp.]|jgi:two-component system sensor histidine kinase BaeS
MRRKQKNRFLNMRIYLTGYAFLLLCITLVPAAAIGYLLGLIIGEISYGFLLLWMLVFSVITGTAFAALFGRKILSPLMKVSEAMGRVTEGDFTVVMNETSRIREVRETCVNFNKMVQALKATEMLQSDFISNVSHEFRTPINAIEGYAMLLQEKQLSVEEQEEYVEKILFNTKRVSELMSNILLLSKVENQMIHMEKSWYRLDEQIRQAIVLLEPKWSKKRINFDVEMEQVNFCGTESLMFHVWMNLLDNGIKFSPEGGTVMIRLNRRNQEICFLIRDEGPGITDDVSKHIFEKFYQADSSHKLEGNGLGLALVKRILNISGGEVRLEKTTEPGACFLVRLPDTDKMGGNV